MDPSTNVVASHIDNMINLSTLTNKQRLINIVNGGAQNQTDEVSVQKFIESNKTKKESLAKLKQIPIAPVQTNSVPKSTTKNSETPPQPKSSTQLKNDIIKFAKNDNLSLLTISKEINKDSPGKEVVISLR